jgi:hypothetical protein
VPQTSLAKSLIQSRSMAYDLGIAVAQCERLDAEDFEAF